MSGLVLLAAAIVIYGLGYRFYGGFLSRLFGIDDSRPTPAHEFRDDVDYMPTRPFVLFGHHFASIAGAGPVVGPIMAAYFGWAPVVLWLLIGCVFVGAMHDMAAMTLSVRNRGRSIASVVEGYIGYGGRQLFLAFCFSSLVLVVAVFAGMVAGTFVASPGVATSSILFIAVAPVFGFLVYRRGVALLHASLVFVPLVFFFIWLGTVFPLDIATLTGWAPEHVKVFWIIVLMVYAAAASVLPVWTLLQPRDYLNSYLLYAMLIFGILGVVVYQPSFQLAAFEGVIATDFLGKNMGIFPFLFITVACGACSGFHSLVASGTSSKQIDKESHIQPVAYGSMLVEGVLGIVALIAVGYLAKSDISMKFAGGASAPLLFAQGLAQFGTKLGLPSKIGISFVSLSVSAFLLTTLDTATRLARFTLQELFAPSVCKSVQEGVVVPSKLGLVRRWGGNMYVATIVCVLLSAWLATGEEGARIWPIFGASNQLLAALTLLVASLWLIHRHAKPLVAIIPMFIMLAVSGVGLWQLAARELSRGGNVVLGVVCVILLALAIGLIVISIFSLFASYTQQQRS